MDAQRPNDQRAATRILRLTTPSRTRRCLKGMSVIGTLNNQINYPVEIRVETLTNMLYSNTVYAFHFAHALRPSNWRSITLTTMNWTG